MQSEESTPQKPPIIRWNTTIKIVIAVILTVLAALGLQNINIF